MHQDTKSARLIAARLIALGTRFYPCSLFKRLSALIKRIDLFNFSIICQTYLNILILQIKTFPHFNNISVKENFDNSSFTNFKLIHAGLS